MAEITRSSRLFVMKEVTEGVGVLPDAADKAVVLQDGFSLSGEFTKLENAELKGSIGKAKPVLGLETSKFSFSHYLVASGSEGDAPEYNYLIESCMGLETLYVAQQNTAAGSTAGNATTRALIQLVSNTGHFYGSAIMIKDLTNGYSIRNVYELVATDVYLAQNLTVPAPAAGIQTGKFINYSPQDSGHPSLSMSLYRSNGGDFELARGIKIEEMAIEFTAGEFINCSFTGSGIGYDFDPIEILSTDKWIDFQTWDGVDLNSYQVELTEKIYKDPIELAAEIQAKMTAFTTPGLMYCEWISSGVNAGKFKISSGVAFVYFNLLWNTGTNAANSAKYKLGYNDADDTSVTSSYSDNQLSWASPYVPTYDNAQPLVAKNIEILLGNFNDLVCFEAQKFSVSIKNTKTNIPSACAESGVSGSLMSAREVTGTIEATLTKHDVDKFYRFRSGQETMITVNAGSKTSGNWNPGKCVNIWIAKCTLDTFVVQDSNGIVTISIDFSGYVENSQGEIFINFL